MNIYVENGLAMQPYAVELTTTSTGFTYKLRDVYVTANLEAAWAQADASGYGLPSEYPTPATPVYAKQGQYTIYDNPKFSTQTVDFSEIQTLSDFSDHAVYMIYTPESANFVSVNPKTENTDSTNPDARWERMTNIYAKTLASKAHPYAYTNRINGRLISIGIPFSDSPFSDWNIIVSAHDASLVDIKSGETPIAAPDQQGKYFHSTLPNVVFVTETATVAADDKVTLNFKLVNADGSDNTTESATIYLKTTAGVLNKTQVVTQNGVGSVALIASHLASGDVAKVSCGFKYFSGAHDCIVTVS
jgi:hypothetical protein